MSNGRIIKAISCDLAEGGREHQKDERALLVGIARWAPQLTTFAVEILIHLHARTHSLTHSHTHTSARTHACMYSMYGICSRIKPFGIPRCADGKINFCLVWILLPKLDYFKQGFGVLGKQRP